MLESIPDKQLDYWYAFSRIKPFGHSDRLLALIACILYNSRRPEGEEPMRIEDLLPISLVEPTEEEKMLQEMKDQLAEMRK